MYGFENETYLKVLHGAVDNIEVIKDIIEKVEEKGFDNVFLVGTGGTYSMVSPLAYMLKTNSTLEWYYEIAAELVAAKPKKLGERSLMITASLSGTTKETIAAAEYATSVGATVISLVGEADSPLGVASTYAVANEASIFQTAVSTTIIYSSIFYFISQVKGETVQWTSKTKNWSYWAMLQFQKPF